MKPIQVGEDIVPISELKAHASRLLARVAKSGQPLIVTQNGRPAGVVLSPAEFDRFRERERFLQSIAAGLADAEAGRTMDAQTLRQHIAARRGESAIP